MVTPDDDHLRELAGALGLLSVDERKQERLAEKLGPYFGRPAARVPSQAQLGQADMLAAAQMGPAAWHAGETDLAARVRSCPSR